MSDPVLGALLDAMAEVHRPALAAECALVTAAALTKDRDRAWFVMKAGQAWDECPDTEAPAANRRELVTITEEPDDVRADLADRMERIVQGDRRAVAMLVTAAAAFAGLLFPMTRKLFVRCAGFAWDRKYDWFEVAGEAA